MKLMFIEDPFCPVCGEIRPKDKNDSMCIPCANKGHYYRLIVDESDRLSSLTKWIVFWSKQEFTSDQIKKIPTYINLTKYTFSKIRSIKGI